MTKPDNFIRTPYFENCAELGVPELFIVLDQEWFKKHKEEILKLDSTMGSQPELFIINDPKVRLLLALRWS